MLSLYRKKESNYEVSSEPVTITNKVASVVQEQQSSEAGMQQADQPNAYDNPIYSDSSLTITNNNASSTAKVEEIEMQKMQQ